MDWLNYHHLHYFWLTAREGSIARASQQLRLAPPTLSGQIHALEDALGEKLFERRGRSLALTDFGRLVYRHADDIFTAGRELMDTVQGRPSQRQSRLYVGVVDSLAKLIAYRLLQPVLALPVPVRMVCVDDRPERLLAALATHELDVVLADAPTSPSLHLRTYSHLLGSCPMAIFAAARLAAKFERGFPQSLNGAPFLLPGEHASLRKALEHWFNALGIRPEIVAEFSDSALMKVFGEAGGGLFAAPAVIEREIRRHYRVKRIGLAAGVAERYYAITAERKFKHPAVLAIFEAAHNVVFQERI